MNTGPGLIQRLTPPWWPRYRIASLGHDLMAGLIVALLLIPQGLAYASLAGVPAQYGLYASLLPLVFYGLFGSSAVMSVGPVAITSLLTASALAPLAAATTGDYVAASALLAFLSGLFLFAAGLLRLGALAQLLSHPVVTAFITGAALLIIVSQLKPLLGIHAEGESSLALMAALLAALPSLNPLAAGLGGVALVLLLVARRSITRLLTPLGVPEKLAIMVQRLLPMIVVLTATLLVYLFDWEESLAVVGALPAGTPDLGLPVWRLDWVAQLWLPALVIGVLGFVESISIAQAFARQARAPLDANAELRGLGAANVGSALAGGFPVTGGFSRTLVNAEAGAQSPVAGFFASAFVLMALWFATNLFAYLPVTVLAATIIVAALQLVNPAAFRHAWRYDRSEAAAMAATATGVLVFGVEIGIAVGVALSLINVVWRSSRPHIAVVGRVPDTEHFRNVLRHQVETAPGLLMLRVDENLFFANAESVARKIHQLVDANTPVEQLVLLMSSVSRVDVTALEMLLHLNEELLQKKIRLHLAEVKGPVSDQLDAAHLPQQLSGRIFLTGFQAYQSLSADDRKPAG